MVFVKVRETYDLHTLPNKMTVIGVHTPNENIIKRNYPGLLMQCKMYRPVKCDVRMACASILPLDPLGVGTTDGDVAPEDVFNPILYKTVSNKSMDLIEQFINRNNDSGWTARGDSVDATNDGILSDDFNLYYGLLSNTHDWKHASPQAGLQMNNIVPLVYEVLYNLGTNNSGQNTNASAPDGLAVDGSPAQMAQTFFKGKAHSMPFMNCTVVERATGSSVYNADSGFGTKSPDNYQTGVPAPKVMCACLIVPPSRLHQLFYRLVCEWTLEFSSVRSIQEITSWQGVASIGEAQHVQDYDFGNSKILSETTDLVDTSADSGIKKVM